MGHRWVNLARNGPGMWRRGYQVRREEMRSHERKQMEMIAT